MNKKTLSFLVCPKCSGQLELQSRKNLLVCHADRLAFPVRKGVPILLLQDAQPLDADRD